MRLKRKSLLICYFAFFFVFIPICYYIINTITRENAPVVVKSKPEPLKLNPLEEAIKNNVKRLPSRYRETQLELDNNNIAETFIANYQSEQIITNYKDIWNQLKGGIRENKLFHSNSHYLGTALKALRSARILSVDVDTRGSQLKLFLTLEGEVGAVFKPQWHSIDKIISGAIYAGEDRFNSEVFAFYLSGLLDFRSVPFAVDRTINLKEEVYPVATERLRNTIFQRGKNWCVFGICYYCKPTSPACSQNGEELRGALIYHIPRKLEMHRSPWRRKYKGNKMMRWQTQNDYCDYVKKRFSLDEILDLVDASIFDFLIQNGDRHDYETIKNKIVLLDNGKGLGNPFIHQMDILAPLYQCCRIRYNTWSRLLALSGDNFRKYINKLLANEKPIINESHLIAIEERLLLIYSAVDLCQSRHPKTNIFV